MAILTHDETVSITKIFGVYLCDAMGVTSNKKLKGKKLNSVLIKFVLCPHWLWWKVQNVFTFKAGCNFICKINVPKNSIEIIYQLLNHTYFSPISTIIKTVTQ